MKSFTDLNQSKKLAEILPKDSADMGWYYSNNPNAARNQMWVGTKPENADIPCWSLVALLRVLPYPELREQYNGNWTCKVSNAERTYIWEDDNSIDACVAMIEKLHEQKLL